MVIELYHFKLTTKNNRTKVIQTINGSIRATSREHSMYRLEQKIPNLTNGMFEVIAFFSKTSNEMANSSLC